MTLETHCYMLSEDNKKHIQKLKSDYNQHPKKTSINRAFIKVIKDNQEPDDEYLTYDSGDKTWTYFTEHGFQESLKPREGISHDAFSKAQQSFLVDRKFEEVFELIERAKSHSEPKLIVDAVRNEIQNGVCRQRIDGLYIHSVLTPCDSCHEIILKLARILELNIYVTYSEVSFGNGKKPMKYEANLQRDKPFKLFDWSKTTYVLFYSYSL